MTAQYKPQLQRGQLDRYTTDNSSLSRQDNDIVCLHRSDPRVTIKPRMENWLEQNLVFRL